MSVISTTAPGLTTGEFSSDDACRMTGASYRQLDYWSRCGYLGDHLVGRGSGSHRRFGPHDIEIIDTVRQLSEIGCLRTGPMTSSGGCRERAFHLAVDAVRAHPVIRGEWLIVTLNPTSARRMLSPSLAGQCTALWAVPLRSIEDLTS